MPALDRGALTEAVKAEALRLGFVLAGVTTPDPPEHFSTFESWLGEGRHGQMAYLATERSRQRRADPRLILPECHSILVVAAAYPASPPLEDASPGLSGRVASYAWGDDYHDALPPRLQKLVAFIEAQVGHPVPNRWYTDTGPLLERDLAQRAGLGWIGKNTCLIHPGLGSYFFLAEILLAVELLPDPPFATDQCGTCTRCLEACPTQCILPDRTLDARRCISYLTIELKDSIPLPLRPGVGNWVFGCDVCQQVCPWNERFAPASGDPAFAPRSDVPQPELPQELALTPAAFAQKFHGSPLKRAKLGGYLRNAAVALGNTRKPQAIPALAEALGRDDNPLLRSHAAWAMGRVGGPDARILLASVLETETDPAVRQEIAWALQALSGLTPPEPKP